jgi:hypothetical protein
MQKWLVFVSLLVLLMFPSPAAAQGGIKLKSVDIELWAEYDQPTMLVIHEFVVDESVSLPVQIKVRFPTDGNLTAVASLADGQLMNIGYEGPETQGNWQTVTLNVQSYTPYRVEYYQPFTRDGKTRTFAFQWFGDYTVNEFNVTVQLPADSTEIVADPPFSSTVQSNDGNYLVGIVSRGLLKMGQSYEFKIEYQRDSDAVTKQESGSNVQPSEPVNSNTEGRVSVDNLPWIIGGFGLALIGLALFFYWRSTQTPDRKPRRRSRSGNSPEDAGEEAYCHECGTRAHSGDRFCRTCGSRLRA